jgi:glycosyltransferase involved in cell wall biosynthesis
VGEAGDRVRAREPGAPLDRDPAVTPRLECAAVIPARDGMPDVLEAVRSALDQAPPPAEVIVVDDASTDGTGDAVERAFGTAVRVIRGRFDGAAAARNAGWRSARAPWIGFLDADDLWLAGKLEEAQRCLEAAPEAAWFFSDGRFRMRDGGVRESWLEPYAEMDERYVGRPVAQLIDVNFVLTSSVVARREALEALGGFDVTLSHAEDVDLWIRLARRWPAAGSRRVLVRYQHRAEGLTQLIEPRLLGDVALFGRLGADPTLDQALRRHARRRAARAWYKLAVNALRDGRAAEARRRLRRAWLFPERSLSVALAWGLSLMPGGAVTRVRREAWATRTVGRQATRQRRVSLRAASAGAARGGRP